MTDDELKEFATAIIVNLPTEAVFDIFDLAGDYLNREISRADVRAVRNLIGTAKIEVTW